MLELQTINWGYNLTDRSAANARLSTERRGEVIVEATTPNPCDDAATMTLATRLVTAYNAVEGIPTDAIASLAPGELARILGAAYRIATLGALFLPEQEAEYQAALEQEVSLLQHAFTAESLDMASACIEVHPAA